MKSTEFIFVFYSLLTSICCQNTKDKIKDSNNSEKKVIVADSKVKQVKPNYTFEKVAFKKNKYFTLLSATSQSWIAGVAGGGSGIEYYFKVRINTIEKINFDSAWINTKSFKIFFSQETASIISEPINFRKGDSITLRISDTNIQNSKTANSKSPISFDGAALISFKVNNNQEYFVIKQVKKQITPNRS